MATQDNNSLETLINALRNWPTVSTPVYVDSNGRLAQGNVPFPLPMAGVKVTGMTSTAVSTLDISGAAETDNAGLLMSGQLVGGARVTTWTKTGFIRVTVTDATGVVTNGDHYIQIGTLS